MEPLKKLVSFLENTIAQEGQKTIDVLSGYIAGELLGDYEGKYSNLYENNPIVQRIGEIASDLEISNGSDTQLNAMWNDIKQLTGELKL